MSFLSDWDDIFASLEATRKKYGGTSIGASVAGASAGKGFRFPDEDDANKIIRRFQERARTIGERKRLIEKARDALGEGFSRDDVSQGYVQRAIESLRALDELNDSALKYAQQYAEKIEAAKQAKHAHEGGISGGIGKMARALD